ncbi:MAG: transcription-repair coupling factor [Planctomycetota bacterium]|jgi:transcription-repair coupling factor (superfamily II helicase)
MQDVLRRIGSLPSVKQLPDLLRANGKVNVVGTAGSGSALVAAWFAGNVRTSALVVCPTGEEAEEFAEDVNLFRGGLACHFPALEVLPGDVEEPSEAILRARLCVLRHLAFEPEAELPRLPDVGTYLEPGPEARVIATSVNALIQPTCSVDELRRGSRTVAVGDEADPHELVTWLVDNDYLAVPQVQMPGQYCLRGGILDVYAHGVPQPVRIEFFGDEVDSIRVFDPFTQLSTERVPKCLFAIAEHPSREELSAGASLLSYLAPDALLFLAEPERLWQRARELFEQTERRGLLTAPEDVEATLAARPTVSFAGSDEGVEEAAPVARVEIQQRDTFGPDMDSMVAELGRICGDYERTILCCIGEAEADRFRALLQDRQFEHGDRLEFCIGRLNHGALCQEAGFALIPHHRLFGRYRQRRVVVPPREARPLDSVQELETGDLVVHVNHGIGRFRGTGVMEQEGTKREFLSIEFAENVHIHVPCDRIELVHRYIGVGGRRPELSRIRGASWRRAKARAQKAVEDMATELLEMQAVRETQRGIAAPADTEWQRQFDSEFPYEETEDQADAIEQVKRDMCAGRPMDRLICGDVGYGKTEIAMRAAFRSVNGGWQVAVLVPTTVLAQQHFRTFSERMADYPVRVEMLSRFLTGSETQRVLEGMADGTVDIVIGTHRLLQDDVTFKNIGLVIIDEEQRFGVEHKEKLKKLRATVDVLTLTATPIPRTLHMSLMGLREISALQTPPRDRQAIETRVGSFNPDLARHAILRELSREGQVFVIHNRVQSIDAFAERLQSIVPEARMAVAHGQMPERELAETMDAFLEGEVDVLISTTIVESGLDIPNANTIILDRAELLGLAEMHQLRGRVGRYIHKAYAYFFTPASRPVTPEAKSRLDAIRRYSQLGAGFDIALRDLEIRGAGNILGPAQSGHIAAVGYNLYCRLLGRAASRLRGEPLKEPPDVTLDIGLDALLPDDYVPTPRQKMGVYRQLHRAADIEDVREVEAALRDRFGEPPAEAMNLLLEAEIRILAGRAGIASVHLEDGRLHFTVRNAKALADRFEGGAEGPRMVSKELAVVDSGFPADSPDDVALFLRRLLSSTDAPAA